MQWSYPSSAKIFSKSIFLEDWSVLRVFPVSVFTPASLSFSCSSSVQPDAGSCVSERGSWPLSSRLMCWSLPVASWELKPQTSTVMTVSKWLSECARSTRSVGREFAVGDYFGNDRFMFSLKWVEFYFWQNWDAEMAYLSLETA